MPNVEIEYINALAPFDHGVWEGTSSTGETIRVGENALFRRRSDWLVDRICSYLTNEFDAETLRTMSILEVASYDGWVLTQICKRIQFAEALGVEPRLKNIKKGEVGRQLAGVVTPARFIQGTAADLETLLPGRDFDIVMCLGMLHHVASTYDTVASLCAKASKAAIIDSMIVPELTDDADRIAPFVNTRDIVYQGEEGSWSVAAFKYESPYGDGSRPDYGIVNVPSARLIEMSLKASGFGSVNALGSESDFFDESGQKLRGVKELLCASKRELAKGDLERKWKAKVENAENVFCRSVLPAALVASIASVLKLDAVVAQPEASMLATASHILSKGLDQEATANLARHGLDLGAEQTQILSVLFRAPEEKGRLEVAKYLLAQGQTEQAVAELQSIVGRQGCDWWSFYRSCYLLRDAFKRLGDLDNSEHYGQLLLLSNEHFPF